MRASFAYPIKLTCAKKLVEQCLETNLPHDAHKLCTQKLGLSLTKFCSFENKFVTKFNSRRDLIDAVVAGCYIPLWSGFVAIPKFMGQRFVDGAYSNNMPKFTLGGGGAGHLDNEHANVVQLAVTPFAAKVDVSPPDKCGPVFKVMGTHYHFNWNNFTRSLHAMLPHKTQLYKVYILAGHRDMKNFVLDTNMVKCRQCFVTRSARTTNDNTTRLTLIKSSSSSPTPTSSSSCLLCLKMMEKVDSLTVPQEMLDVLNE